VVLRRVCLGEVAINAVETRSQIKSNFMPSGVLRKIM
jgi:hypothetical protein